MKQNEMFYNKIVKQGNSLCLRIPRDVVKGLGLANGVIVSATLVNLDKEVKKLPRELISAYHSADVMKKFSFEEIQEFLKYIAIEKTSGENLRVDKKYEDFKKALKDKKTKEVINGALHSTAFWKNAQKEHKE